MRLRWIASLPVILFACLANGRTAQVTPPLTTLLDRYVAGQFDAAIGQLSDRTNFDDLLRQLRTDGPVWLDARGPRDRARRELAAATFALEAARLDEWHEWKWIHRGEDQLGVLAWRPAPLLIEWGCALLRQQDTPRPIERWWQLAALAVAERSEDAQFLVGDLNAGLGAAAGEIGNRADEIRHLDHAAARFPAESRFILAQAVAREWTRDSAIHAKALAQFQALKSDPDVGGEATMRAGGLTLRGGHADAAIAVLNEADRLTRDPYVVYLADFLKGQANEQLRRPVQAEAAYRAAVAAVPNAQSASLALASLLFVRDRRADAERLAAGAIDLRAMPRDPWREYAHADDRFWPRLIKKLREEIASTAIVPNVPNDSAPVAAATRQTPPAADANRVTVDVSVLGGGRPVDGLRAEDFVLMDNGVRQHVEMVERAPAAVDVTLVLDVSGDQRGTRIDAVAPSAPAADVNARVREMAPSLGPDDRLRVLGIDSYVTPLVALQPAPTVKPIGAIDAGGLASLYDAMVAALLQPVEPSRRHVVVVATKGKDTVSATSAQAVRAIAERAEARLHVLMMARDADNEDSRYKLQCFGAASTTTGTPPDPNVGLCWPTRRFWVPLDRRTFESTPAADNAIMHSQLQDGRMLADAAALTGGALTESDAIGAAAIVRTALDEIRQSYRVRYTPQGVKLDGWHTLSVTVPRAPGATVRARRGYAIAAAAAPAGRPGTSSASFASRLPSTYEELIDAYSRSEFDPAMDAIREWPDPAALLKRFDESGNPWPATPAREAVLALEVAEAGLFDRRQDTLDDTITLLERFQRLIRDPLEPGVFERYWLWVELCMLQGKIRPTLAESFVQHALDRFPDEPRFLLARAIVTDQWFPFTGAPRSAAQTGAGTAAPDHIVRVTERYEAAMTAPETATEARVRLAWFLHRIGRDDDALKRLDEIDDASSKDRAMSYLHQLFRGHVQIALGRTDAAVTSYRRAIQRWPAAQSAQVALMNALIRAGQRDEAETVAERIQTAPLDQTDPWFAYWYGDYRLYPAALGTLRGMIR